MHVYLQKGAQGPWPMGAHEPRHGIGAWQQYARACMREQAMQWRACTAGKELHRHGSGY